MKTSCLHNPYSATSSGFRGVSRTDADAPSPASIKTTTWKTYSTPGFKLSTLTNKAEFNENYYFIMGLPRQIFSYHYAGFVLLQYNTIIEFVSVRIGGVA